MLISGGQIAAVGESREVLRNPWLREHRAEVIELDCRGKVVLPGFVDSHTHPVFVAPRLIDFEKRVHPVRAMKQLLRREAESAPAWTGVRAASEATLADRVLSALRQAQSQGTTTLEAKSGYGLDAASEIKSLKAIRRAAEQWQGTVVATFLGAHVTPTGVQRKS